MSSNTEATVSSKTKSPGSFVSANIRSLFCVGFVIVSCLFENWIRSIDSSCKEDLALFYAALGRNSNRIRDTVHSSCLSFTIQCIILLSSSYSNQFITLLSMSHSNANVSSFLIDNSSLFDNLQIGNGVLDLACGKGRNGLFLVSHNVPVLFADNNEAHLQSIVPIVELAVRRAKKSACWLVDFEAKVSEGKNPLIGKSFDAVIVFNYLHRPLFPFIREAIRPGGLIVYETFTVDQKRFGRPSNPDFLLEQGELVQAFAGWELIRNFEGEVSSPERAIARLIARKQAKK